MTTNPTLRPARCGRAAARAVAAPPAKEAPAPADIERGQGQAHRLDRRQEALPGAGCLTTDSDKPVFWSADGKDFYALRIFGGGSEGDDAHLKKLDRVFWEPRVDAPYKASFDYKKRRQGRRRRADPVQRAQDRAHAAARRRSQGASSTAPSSTSRAGTATPTRSRATTPASTTTSTTCASPRTPRTSACAPASRAR